MAIPKITKGTTVKATLYSLRKPRKLLLERRTSLGMSKAEPVISEIYHLCMHYIVPESIAFSPTVSRPLNTQVSPSAVGVNEHG